MKRYTIICVILCLGYFCKAQSLAIDPDDPHWLLTWQDEFNGTSVNANLWYQSYPWGNCADQSALTTNWENHVLNNGIISLMTYEENSTCYMWENNISPTYYPKPYTSAHLVSRDAFKYGYFEIRSRFPKCRLRPTLQNGKGFSPTFWLFPCHPSLVTGYVKYSEIDIYEIKGTTNKYTCNAHYADADHYTIAENGHYYSWWNLHDSHDYGFIINDGHFHTYSMMWDSSYLRFYFDGNEVCHFYRDENFVPGNLLPMNIIIANSACASNFNDTISSSTILPYPYDVDYVKVYNLACDDETIVTDIPDFSQYYYAVKKRISLGSATVFPPNTTTYLHATDYIELRPGFEVSGTSQIKLIIDSPCLEDNTFEYYW